MAFDAFFLSAVLSEIREKALGARVEKIHQPGRDTLILLLKCTSGREKLLIAANPASPRIHFTGESPENPAEPPMFCMLLRKHLSGARLTEIRQPSMERIAEFSFDAVDEMGFPVRKRLLVELMGRTCNVYLLDDSGRIIDCLRRIGLDDSARRQALPGLYYQEPEKLEKSDPSRMEEPDFRALLREPGPDLLADRLMDRLGGLSPLVCREAALFSAGSVDARLDGLDPASTGEKLYLFFREHLTHGAPYYYALPDGTPKAYAFCPIAQYGSCRTAPSFSALLDLCCGVRDRKDAIRQKGQALRKILQNLLQRTRKKLAIQEMELAGTLDRERTRQLGDIVTANLHRITRGQKVLRAEDFYDEAMTEIDIPLSPLLSPQQNAARFYKDYARMKNAEKELTRQIELGQTELRYLQSVLEELDRADSDQALEEIRQELQAGGYVRAEAGKKKMRVRPTAPLKYQSTDGFAIYVGRNNRQNDELTFKTARKDDLWLHAQKIPGSHVIIACAGAPVPDDTITQAAQLAAYHSQGRQGQNVPVDVTPVKQVKKPSGAKPGMVVYYTYRTVIVNPKDKTE